MRSFRNWSKQNEISSEGSQTCEISDVSLRENFPSGEHTILLFSPETQKEFYLGAPNSINLELILGG